MATFAATSALHNGSAIPWRHILSRAAGDLKALINNFLYGLLANYAGLNGSVTYATRNGGLPHVELAAHLLSI